MSPAGWLRLSILILLLILLLILFLLLVFLLLFLSSERPATGRDTFAALSQLPDCFREPV